jgi:hypothetical protein
MNSQNFLITPDLSEAVEQTAVVPGIYSVRVTDLELKTSKAGGQYIKWTMTIFGAEGELTRFNNHKVWYNTMLSGKGAGMLKGFYKACKSEDFAGGAFDWSTLVGSEVSATLVEGKDQQGQPSGYPEVKALKSIKLPF